MTPEEWIVSGQTGSSSKTIWAALVGVKNSLDPSVPQDPGDFGRCFRLLTLVPGWRDRLQEVAAAFPMWEPMVTAWDELEKLYTEELEDDTGSAPRLYKRMREVVEQCRKIDRRA